MEFKFITHDNHDAYFNLASEEYLLKHTDGYYIYLWINDPAVIVGINQNTLQEVNLAYTNSNGVKVVRRLTGGGAVYHDGGNLCYTVIAPYNQNENNYVKFTAPVIEYLNSLGVKAEFSGRNDIIVDGHKISGNAQTVYKDRIMHHGTILFSSDLNGLTKALNPNKLKIESKGIKSVRARVTNVCEYLKKEISIEQFKSGLAEMFKKSATVYEFSEHDLKEIEVLRKEKYSTYEWNIGKSPKGKSEFIFKFDFGVFNFSFDLEEGRVCNAAVFGDFFSFGDVKEFEKKLNGIKFTKSDMMKAFNDVGKYINGATADEVVGKIFGD